MKNNWPVNKLGEIINRSENSPKIKKEEYKKNGNFPIIDQSQLLIAGYTNNIELLYRGELPVIIFGDHTQVIKYIDKPFVRGADGTKIINPNRNIISPRFLFYLLSSIKLKSHGYSRHYQYLIEEKIIIPPLKIQDKIVERLDAIRKAQELIDLQIQKTEELYNSLIQKEIDINKYQKVKISEITKPQEIMDPKKNPSQEYNYVDISSINSNDFAVDPSKIKIFKGKDAPSRARKKIQQGDILFSTVRPNLKRIAIINYPVFNSLASTGFTVLRPDDGKINQNYFGTIICSGIVTDQIIPYIRGAAYPAVSDFDVFNVEIPLPERSKQDKFAEKSFAIQEYKKLLQKQKQLYKELFDSVLDKSMRCG